MVLTPILLPAGACRGREVSIDVWYEFWRNHLPEKCRRAEKVMNYILTPVLKYCVHVCHVSGSGSRRMHNPRSIGNRDEAEGGRAEARGRPETPVQQGWLGGGGASG